MYRDRQELEDIFTNLIREKGERFIEETHNKRMEDFMRKYPEHYAKMTKEEIEEAKDKEREIVDSSLLYDYEYPIKLETGVKTTGDAIPQSTVEIMGKHLVELFYTPCDVIIYKSSIEQKNLKDVFDAVYEMTSEIATHVIGAVNYEKTYRSKNNQNRAKSSIKTKTEELIKLLNNFGVGSERQDKLHEVLEDLYNNTDDYLLRTIPLMTNDLKKQYVKYLSDYLTNLLENKSQQINTFTSEIIEDMIKVYGGHTNRIKK